MFAFTSLSRELETKIYLEWGGLVCLWRGEEGQWFGCLGWEGVKQSWYSQDALVTVLKYWNISILVGKRQEPPQDPLIAWPLGSLSLPATTQRLTGQAWHAWVPVWLPVLGVVLAVQYYEYHPLVKGITTWLALEIIITWVNIYWELFWRLCVHIYSFHTLHYSVLLFFLPPIWRCESETQVNLFAQGHTTNE